MEGKVTEVHYLVPHSWLYVEVKDEKGVPTLWAMEATGHGGLQRVGVKREDLRVGDAVRVRCHLLRDGSNGCLLGFVTPMHGDSARGHGIERDWDGGGGGGGTCARPTWSSLNTNRARSLPALAGERRTSSDKLPETILA